MRAAPAVSCAMCTKKCAHEHTGQRRTSDIPCAMALRLIACSPRRTALLPPLRPKRQIASRCIDASTATSGPHDFTVRFSAVRYRHFASTATRPTIVTIVIRPSERDGMARNVPGLTF